MFVEHTTLIIPTRNRSKSVNNLLNYFDKKNINFQQFLIIDSSNDKKNYKHSLIKKLKVRIVNSLPSTSGQRNLGLKLVERNSKYIMFLDDDIIFYEDSFQNMDKVIQKYQKNNKIVGFGFNLITNIKKKDIFTKLKNNFLLNYFELYPNNQGKVAQSGWHSQIEDVKKDTFVEWVFSGATIYKKDAIKSFRFNEDLGIYSYLEDLFFSYSLSKKGFKLLICKNAKFLNINVVERSNFSFGVKEILNRYKFVTKFNLSKTRFWILGFFRFLKSFLGIFKFNFNYLKRSLGNIYALFIIIINIYEKKK